MSRSQRDLPFVLSLLHALLVIPGDIGDLATTLSINIVMHTTYEMHRSCFTCDIHIMHHDVDNEHGASLAAFTSTPMEQWEYDVINEYAAIMDELRVEFNAEYQLSLIENDFDLPF